MCKVAARAPAITCVLQAREQQSRTLKGLCLPLGQLPALTVLEVSLHISTYLSLDVLRELHPAPQGAGKHDVYPRWLRVRLKLGAMGRRREQMLGVGQQPELPQRVFLTFVGSKRNYFWIPTQSDSGSFSSGKQS